MFKALLMPWVWIVISMWVAFDQTQNWLIAASIFFCSFAGVLASISYSGQIQEQLAMLVSKSLRSQMEINDTLSKEVLKINSRLDQIQSIMAASEASKH